LRSETSLIQTPQCIEFDTLLRTGHRCAISNN
jgi:2-C-methyl-D-erythritol 4-phosphate cytidylyltransferase